MKYFFSSICYCMAATASILTVSMFSGCSKSSDNDSTSASQQTENILKERPVRDEAQTLPQPDQGTSALHFASNTQTQKKTEPFWSDEEFAKGRKLTYRILAGSPMLVMEQTVYERPPFYDGPMPLKFFTTKDTGSSSPGQSVTFSSNFRAWTNEFIYLELNTKNYALANGARAIESKFSRVLAEAKMLEPFIGTTKPIIVEERHFGADGKVIFKCKAHFDKHSGFKLTEDEVSGKKVRDYFFIWPR